MTPEPAEWWPLHPTQRSVWDDQLRNTASAATTIAGWLDIGSPLDAGLLLQAMRLVQSEVPALRLVFRCRNGEPEQRVTAQSPTPIRFLDLHSDPDPLATALAWMQRVAAHPFRLDEGRSGGLLRAALIRLATGRHALFFALHHIACDGVGLSVIGRRLETTLEALSSGHPAPVSAQHAGVAELHDLLVTSVAAYRGSAGFATDHAHWRAHLRGMPRPSLDDRFRGDGASFRVSRRLDPRTEAALRDLARRLRVHWAVFVTAAVAMEAWQRLGSSSVVLGTTVANRQAPLGWSTPAAMCNDVPLRIAIAHDMPLADLVVAVAVATRAAVDHGRYPVAEMRQLLGLSQDAPLWETTVNLLPFTPLRLGPAQGLWRGLGFGVVDMLQLSIQDQGWTWPVELHLDGNRSVFTEASLAARAERLVDLLTRVAGSEVNDPVARFSREPRK